VEYEPTPNLTAEEVGKVINQLQEEIQIIKLQLENLPGYSKGEVPVHLHKLKSDLEKTFASLEAKNELLINAMMKNFGRTQQSLPNFKLPEIGSGARIADQKRQLFDIPNDFNMKEY